jgi:phage gp36-like protein
VAYCTIDDIRDQLDEQKLIQLTDDDQSGAVDEAHVTKAITDADATVDAYCQRRYTVPLTPVPAKINAIGVDLAIYNLYSRRDDTIPDLRKDRQKEAIRFLEKVSEGKIELGASTPAPTNTGNTADITYNDRIFTRSKMRGF